MSESKELTLNDLKNKVENIEWDNKKYLLGKILTIIDGSVSDKVQNKAVKDMINNVWYEAPTVGGGAYEALFAEFAERTKTKYETLEEKQLRWKKDGQVGESNPSYFNN